MALSRAPVEASRQACSPVARRPPSLGPCMGEIQLLDLHFPARRAGWRGLRGLRGVYVCIARLWLLLLVSCAAEPHASKTPRARSLHPVGQSGFLSSPFHVDWRTHVQHCYSSAGGGVQVIYCQHATVYGLPHRCQAFPTQYQLPQPICPNRHSRDAAGSDIYS